MIILTLNCGSSSAKFQVFDWEKQAILGTGMVERIGIANSRIEIASAGKDEFEATKDCQDHDVAIAWIIETLLNPEHGCISSMDEIKACGHRVVHGGEIFKKSAIINDEMIQKVEELYPLAPLHNPANITGIKAAQKALPNITHVAIMDTAWHQTMPSTSYMYALPSEWYAKHNVRRYGFHGTSFLYTAKRASLLLGKNPNETNVIIAHIGNGASICAVKNGVAFDTSMGLTPLEGLVMGTRCGDIDPAIVNYMCDQLGVTAKEIDSILNKKSGLIGITDQYSDRRDIQAGVDKGDEICILAQQMEGYRIKKYIGAYAAALGRVDAVVFTAGVGEMNPSIRSIAVSDLDFMGIQLDPAKNQLSRVKCAETCISKEASPTKIFVIPTDEELVMTEDTYAIVAGTYAEHTNFTYTFQAKDYVNEERAAKLKKAIEKNPAIKDILA